LPASTIAFSGVSNSTIITGGTGALGVVVTNAAAAGANNLNYTLNAIVQSGSATLGAITSGTGSLVPSASQSCTVPATSTNLGHNTISFTATDPNASNSPQSTTAILTVLDHSNASLSSTATQTSQTINFGNVLRGATIPSQDFTIYNRAANTSAAYTANLKLTGFTPAGDSALTTNLASFNGLVAGSGTICTASLNTSNYTTTGVTTIIMSASQLADDSTASGVGNNNNGGITVTLEGNVGNAAADMSNSQTSFGPALTAPVAQNTSYANLESKPTASTGSGGYSMIGSIATILAGTNSSSGSAQTVSMQWRTQTQAERTGPRLLSDVLDLTGMTYSGDETSSFVLQMTYDANLLPGGASSEGSLASSKLILLESLDPNTDEWENAINENIGINQGIFHLAAWVPGDMTLGDWGINTSSHTVWAVLDHNSEFAVATPEPSTLALLAAGSIGLVAYGVRRRRLARNTAQSPDFERLRNDGPPILVLPLRSSYPTNAARRAA